MGFSHRHCSLLFALQLSLVILLSSSRVKSSDEKENLLQTLNSYRASLNLGTLTENKNADCFADQIADQFKNQPCSNTSGSATVPGTEPQLSNYPDLLAKCHLNITNTKEGAIMPVCVPNLVPSLVATNYTQTQYTQYLNDTTYTGAGVGSEGDWMVVVLSTSTEGGSFAPAQNSGEFSCGVNLVKNVGLLLIGFVLVVLS